MDRITGFDNRNRDGAKRAPTNGARVVSRQVVRRCAPSNSRSSGTAALRLASAHAAGEVLGVERFDEDALYANLDWLAAQQAKIEERLFEQRLPNAPKGLFLYDVTSSYLEGEHNAFGAFGYNRDKKRGKPQSL